MNQIREIQKAIDDTIQAIGVAEANNDNKMALRLHFRLAILRTKLLSLKAPIKTHQS